MDARPVPKVGERWSADVTGRVPWARDNYSQRCVQEVEIAWVSRDGRVVEVLARNKKNTTRTSLARSDLKQKETTT